MNPAEGDDPERYASARDEIMKMISDGKAIALLDAYYTHVSSCAYVLDTIYWAATDSEFGSHNSERQSFAQNLLDDWSK